MVIENGEESGNGASGKAGETSCCASCGIAGVDGIKLTTCDANCKLVCYCSIACQRNHRPFHEAMCKKREAELRDDLLFAQPESSCFGDCPLCTLPLALDATKRGVMTCCCNVNKRVMMSCCSKLICNGCCYANMMRELKASLDRTCPFCRHPLPATKGEADANTMKRVETNDPVATQFVGIRCYYEGDYGSAFEYLTKAAGLGDAEAHYYLSHMYSEGEGVEKDAQKEFYHLEEAAIGGNPAARSNLGIYEWNDGRVDRAVKHFIIAANLGDDNSVEMLKQGYLRGLVSKVNFAAALRAHQAAVDAMKSPQREAGAELAKVETLHEKRW